MAATPVCHDISALLILKLTLFLWLLPSWPRVLGGILVRMQNEKAFIAAGLVLFGLMGACALTILKPALPALSYICKN